MVLIVIFSSIVVAGSIAVGFAAGYVKRSWECQDEKFKSK